MTRFVPGWKPWEDSVNEELGLDPTVASGSQFYDKGDGVDRDRQGDWAFQADAKYTEHLSFSLRGVDFVKYSQQAASRGKLFVLAARFWSRGQPRPTDVAVIPFDVFSSMLKRLKELEDAQRAG